MCNWCLLMPVALGTGSCSSLLGGVVRSSSVTDALLCLCRFSACTVACRRPSRRWTRSEPSTENKKCPTTGPCVTSCGLTLKVVELSGPSATRFYPVSKLVNTFTDRQIPLAGGSVPEVLATSSAATWWPSSTPPTTST